MRKLKLFFLCWFLGWAWLDSSASAAQEPAEPPQSSCIKCHLEIGDELAAPIDAMKDDVHAQQGLSCEDCHGGDPKAGFDDDPDAAMNPAKGYIGVPQKGEIPKFCGRCHSDPNYMRNFNPRLPTDQLSRYKTSVHGMRLAQGDTLVATCTSCHGAHGIFKASDSRSAVYSLNVPATCAKCHADPDYMQGYHIATSQYREYQKSVHGVALLEKGDTAAPACNDCHGNHGATPPSVPAVSFVCGQCHANNSDLFRESPHKAAFENEEMPECETCHGSHDVAKPTDTLLGTGPDGLCVSCHDPGSQGAEVAAALLEDITRLRKDIATADSLVQIAARSGMPVSDAQFNLTDANGYLIKARTMVHALSDQKMAEVTSEGEKLAGLAMSQGESALRELQFRRKGLAISLVFIIILAIGLYLRIREVDRRTQF